MIFDKPAYLNIEANDIWYLDKYNMDDIRPNEDRMIPVIIKRENTVFLPHTAYETYRMIMGKKRILHDQRVSICITVYSSANLIYTSGGLSRQYRYELPPSIEKSDIINVLHNIYEDLSRFYVIRNSN